MLRGKLADIDVPVEAILCRNTKCCEARHEEILNKYVCDVSDACLMAAKETIPLTSARKAGRLPGWSEFVEPSRQKSLLWHSIWQECGRPRTGLVADIMRKTRAAYHYAIRSVRRHEQLIVNARFAEAVLAGGNRDLWSEDKRLRCSTMSCSGVVDGLPTPQDISSLFALKYQDLYASVSYDKADMSRLRTEVSI